MIADKVVADLFELVEPSIEFRMWEPQYTYSRDSQGNVGASDGTRYTNFS